LKTFFLNLDCIPLDRDILLACKKHILTKISKKGVSLEDYLLKTIVFSSGRKTKEKNCLKVSTKMVALVLFFVNNLGNKKNHKKFSF